MKSIVSYLGRAFVAASLLAMVATASAQTTLISTGAVWRYMDNGSDQGTAWRSPSFDDSGWLSGPAELGFGDGGEATTNTGGHVTYYYRHSFNVGSASSITNLRVNLKRDDGAVVYINGLEAFRNNMPAGDITYTTVANGAIADDGATFNPFPIPAGFLVDGPNTVAVEIHQNTNTSSDVSFDMELVANPLASIVISSPTNTQTIASATVNITGSAIPAGTNVSLIELYAGNTKVGESTNGTYAVSWQNVTPGNYTLTARLLDSSGSRATSAPVNIVVQAPPATLLVARGSTWRYNNTGTDLGSTWKNLDYDDSSWSGPSLAPIGANLEGGVEQCATVIDIGPGASRHPVVYFRKKFVVPAAAPYLNLLVRIQADDSAVVYLNGTLLHSDGVLSPGVFGYEGGQTRAGADEVAYREFVVPASALVPGTNVLAGENHQVNSGSSDLQFDAELEGVLDTVAPTVAYDPVPGSTVLELSFINVVFSEAVTGVDTADLLINGEAATGIMSNNVNDYTFTFTQPSTGLVQVAWAPTHGIADLRANSFAGGNWSYNLDPNASTVANVIISEFLADNDNGLRDDDGQRNDWLELLNLGPLDANLDGWFLTDSPTNLTRWRIPAVALSANNRVLIWASSKNRTNLNAPLHTNFRLGNDAGGYLALVNAQTNIVSVFSNYPAQPNDTSYGRDAIDPSIVGFFSTPTPGAANSQGGNGFMAAPVFSTNSGVYTNASLTVSISNPNAIGGTIRYTTDSTLPTSSSAIYTAPFVLSANSTIKARIFPPAGTNLLPSAVVARNFIFLDDTSRGFSSKLPTMIISTEGRSIPSSVPPGGARTKGSVMIIDTTAGRSSMGGDINVHELAEFEIFGQTSEGFPKKPIRVELQDAIGNDRDVEVLGMPADSDWRLRNPYNDKTMMNDFLGFELWEKMGHYSVRRRFVEVFLDTGGARVNFANDYYGVMVLCETIKVNSDRVDIPSISPYSTNLAVTDGGFIFKRDKVSVGDLDFTTPGGPGFLGIPLKLHEPKPNDLKRAGFQGITTSFPGNGYTPSGSNQMTYLRNFLGTMERALYTNTWTAQTGTNHYSYYLDPIAFADQMLHVELTKQIDGYRLSDYFTKGRDGRIGPGPVWDWNLAFGNADYAQGGMTNTWYYEITGEQDHPWARRLITGTAGSGGIAGDPEFTQLIADRWAMFRTNVLNGTNLLKRIDEIASLLQESAARDLYGKWRTGLIGVYTWPNPSGVNEGRDVDYVRPTNYYGPIEFTVPAGVTNSIIGQMKKWMLGRYLWMDSQFVKVPSISSGSTMVTNGYPVTITPPLGGTLYYTTNGSDPRLVGGSVNPAAVSTTNPVTLIVNANMHIVARARATNAWKSTWSGKTDAALFTVIPSLRITEIMYNPAPAPNGSPYATEDYEFIEVKNIGATPLNVGGYRISGGVDFTFPNESLAAGESAIIVANIAAYQSRHGNGARILGTFTGRLSNDSESLALLGGLGEVILDFSYQDNWYSTTDGHGFSLVTVNDLAALSAWNTAANWRASSSLLGSPAQNDPAPPARPAVVVSEVKANGAPQDADVIELHNTTGSPVDIGGWYLTDDFDSPKKYTIPPTSIPANGYVIFYSSNSFNAGPGGFGLGADGDDIYLFSGDGLNLTGYAHGFDFGASASNSTFGRYIISTGNDHFVVQSASTLGGANAGPLVGPIVINEISYHPADLPVNNVDVNNVQDEFIELHNTSGVSVPLYDPANPANTWHVTGTVDFDFPAGVSIPAGGYALVVGFNPADSAALAAFRDRNSVPPSVPVYGPWSGNLNNDVGPVELQRPDVPGTNGGVNYILVERVNYEDHAPWPAGADGVGLSLQRLVRTTYANDPTNWVAALPTPGANVALGGTAPVITSQPGNQSHVFTVPITFAVTATGSDLRYQWRLNGANIANGTNSTYNIPSFHFTHMGVYNVLVYNNAGFALGTNFNLSGRTGLAIQSHPSDALARVGQTTNFTVVAIGSGVVRYQWKFNGNNIANATNATLILANIQVANDGTYTCQVTDDYDTMISDSATLTVIFAPSLTLRPFNMTGVEGGSVSFSVAANGTTPLNFRWQTNHASGAFTNMSNAVVISSASNSTIVFTNIPLAFTGMRVRSLLTNIAGQANTTNATLTVLADTDRDGLPDSWETGRIGFSIIDPSDALRDDDNDGMRNGEEYFAGTDPFDQTSYLKVELGSVGPAVITFNAVSNRSYSVYYTDTVPGLWQKLGDVLSRANTRTETLVDPSGNTNRFYQLVTPTAP